MTTDTFLQMDTGCPLGYMSTIEALKTNSHIPFSPHAIPLPCHVAKSLDCVSHLIYKVQPCLIHMCHATAMPFWKQLLKAMAQRGLGTAWHVWISIGHPEMACGKPAHVQLLPATTRSSTKIVIRSISIRKTVGRLVLQLQSYHPVCT
jgi:hypothetical protein